MNVAVTLAPITRAAAREVFEQLSAFRGEFDFAIAARDAEGKVHGVIALNADGERFEKAHIYTDGNAQVGSLLYGAAWRAAMALGYTGIAKL